MFTRKPETVQPSMYQVFNIDSLIPESHILRRINRRVKLEFVSSEVKHLYSADTGRPCIEPELVFRMWLLGYLYGMSEKRLCEEVTMHAGYRWFCGLDFNQSVPDRTTLVKLRRRWAEDGAFERVMKQIVSQCMAAGLVDGRNVAVDGTEVTANASVKSLEKIRPPVKLDDYLKRLSADDQGDKQSDEHKDNGDPGEPRRKAGDPEFRGEKFSNATHRSKTDPEARLFRKGPGKETKLRYLVHDLVDLGSGVIVETSASQANSTAERQQALSMLDMVLGTPIGERVKRLYADAGYAAGSFLHEILARGIEPMVSLKKLETEPVPSWKLKPKNLEQFRNRKAAVNAAIARNHTRRNVSKRRRSISRARVRIEHTFAEAKVCHGLDRARCRGLMQVDVQAKMTAMAQNVRRLANSRSRRQAPILASGLSQMAVELAGRIGQALCVLFRKPRDEYRPAH